MIIESGSGLFNARLICACLDNNCSSSSSSTLFVFGFRMSLDTFDLDFPFCGELSGGLSHRSVGAAVAVVGDFVVNVLL